MSYQLKVTFVPEEPIDYQHHVTFITETERFILHLIGTCDTYLQRFLTTIQLPFVAIGPRPILSFPDELTLPQTVVKTVSEKKIWVQNIGGSCARFSVLVEQPFEVSPSKATLGPKETMHFTFTAKPPSCTLFLREMIVCFESGEKLRVKLQVLACEANVYLERTKLVFNDTYEGLSDQKSIKLYNNSEHVVQYHWKLHESVQLERNEAMRIKSKWRKMKEHESLRGNKLETYEIIDYAGHTKVYDRIYCDEVEEFESSDQFLYENKVFKIEPLVKTLCFILRTFLFKYIF